MNMKPSVAAVAGPQAPAKTAATVKTSAIDTASMPEPRVDSAVSQTRTDDPHTLDSRQLLGDQSVVRIQHGGEVYRLQTTRQGKLILTK